MLTPDKIYFASDFHLGAYPKDNSRQRERIIVAWLDEIKKDAEAIYLVGDIFDFWFEYATVVPKGYIRFLGKLAELSDLGIKITLFKGNHDMWMFDYLKEECGVEVISDELAVTLDGKSFYIHHGDGLGPGDRKYKLLKKVFRSPFCQWLFARLHPNLGIGIAHNWSKHSRLANTAEEKWLGATQEWLIIHAQELEQQKHHDYYIFGHRHLPYEYSINADAMVVNLGEWINFHTYAVWDKKTLQLCKYTPS